MSGALDRFFAAAPALLFGEATPAEFAGAVGPSPSGADRLRFYQILIERNLAKILRDFYGGLAAWMERDRPGLWARLIRDYARAHPPSGWDPNRYAAAFPEFLAARRASDDRLREVDEELADFYWIEYCAFVAGDEVPAEKGPDGVDHRVFVRQYTRPIPTFARALRRGESPALPGAAPTLTIVFRSPASLGVEILYPQVAAIAALIRRQGGDPAALVPGLGGAEIDAAEAELRRRHVLMDR